MKLLVVCLLFFHYSCVVICTSHLRVCLITETAFGLLHNSGNEIVGLHGLSRSLFLYISLLIPAWDFYSILPREWDSSLKIVGLHGLLRSALLRGSFISLIFLPPNVVNSFPFFLRSMHLQVNLVILSLILPSAATVNSFPFDYYNFLWFVSTEYLANKRNKLI